MKQFFKLIVYSNLFVSLCVVGLTYRSLLLLHLPINKNINILIVNGLATFFIYNFQRIIRIERLQDSTFMLTDRLLWLHKNKNYLRTASIISVVFLVQFIFKLHFKLYFNALLLLFFAGFISFFYVVKIIKINNKWISLRELPYVKIFLIATVWSITTVAFPFFYQENIPELSLSLIIMLIQQFIFIIAITIPFDNRDEEVDKLQHIKTFSVLLGKKNAIKLAVILLFFCVILSVLQGYLMSDLANLRYVYEILAFSITAIIIIPTQKKQHELYYGFLVESTMLILTLSVILI